MLVCANKQLITYYKVECTRCENKCHTFRMQSSMGAQVRPQVPYLSNAIKYGSSGMASAPSPEGFYGRGGQWLMLVPGWLVAAGSVFIPSATSVPPGPSLVPVGGLLGGGPLGIGWLAAVMLSPGGGGGQVVVGWLAAVVLSPSATSELPNALVGP
jgi:hypothetical protein